MFHPVVDAWFTNRFAGPTAVQARAFPAIASGRDTLIAAPTGSGKTLAAFLFCLDRLVVASWEGTLEERTEVVYVSPLKALSNDIQKNLDEPIAGIGDLAVSLGRPRPLVRAAVRTGDTPASERQRAARHPPHILVTTPESLYILLTSVSGRRSLAAVRTVIVDEIHAVAADKRGAHLALSLERLEALVVDGGNPRPQRLGLSATMRPVEVVARLLVGGARPMPVLVDAGMRRDLDLAVEVPRDELGAVCTNEQWTELYDRVAELALAHRSTLVFVNTRRLVERLAHHLGQRLGEGAVAAHHGSLSRARRLLAEQRLKAGDLRVVVATASLELGIDIGAVDLACLVGSPRSIATALQRIGRSGHALVATPKGRLFPLTRDQLLECAAIVRAARRGVLDAIALRSAPLDILAQQIVATCAAEEQGEDELFERMRQAAPYAELTRAAFDQVVGMLSEGIATRRGRAGALLHRDAVGKRLRGRRGARLAALTSGGAIPDNADYDVLLLPDASKVGTIHEDYAIESMAGDVFLLGNTSWRIKRVEQGKVWVEDAAGVPPSIPFWLGEGPARTPELSAQLGDLRVEILERHQRGEAPTWLVEACALDERGARLACDYVLAAHTALGGMPSQALVIAERFFDESGGMQLVLHAPFGGRINRAWGMALRKRFCRSFDFELQAAATDDGVLLSLGAQHSFPLESILDLLHPDGLREVLEQAALQAPMFGTRFRWNAARALALPRFQGGRRVPPPIQRMRSDDLLAAVFPAQQGCQDNAPGGPIELPDHPLVNETVRDCLSEPMDAEGLAGVLRRLRAGEIAFLARDTAEPSVLAHEILNSNPYTFLDDAPLEERRARAVSVRRGLPASLVERFGALDPEALRTVIQEARPDVRDADELHDRLLDALALPEAMGEEAGWVTYLERLVAARRASRLVDAAEGGAVVWVAAERRSLAASIWPARTFEPALVAPEGTPGARPADRDEALAGLVRAHLALAGPVTAEALAARFEVDPSDVAVALARVEADGAVLRGRFSPDAPAGQEEWCDRRLLARIHRLTVQGLRRAIEPASPADLMRFLFAWQGLRKGAQGHGRDGLARVIAQLQGFEVAAGAWERDVLPARVAAYDPAWLDHLCLTGEVVWGRFTPRDAAGAPPTRAAPVTFARRPDLGWLLAAPTSPEAAPEALTPVAQAVLGYLGRAGASFLDDLAAGTAAARGELEDALWELVAAGRITGDGFAGLRALMAPARSTGRWWGRPPPPAAAGRWSLLRAPARPLGDVVADPLEVAEAQARQYLARYGVVLRELLTREPRAPAWRDLVQVYRRLEMRGEIRGGRLVAGFVGEQFALPEALDALRAIRREPPRDELIRLSACDPLNLVGIVTPGPRVAAHLGNWVECRDGVPVPVEGVVGERAEAPLALALALGAVG